MEHGRSEERLVPPFPIEKVAGVYVDMEKRQVQWFSTDCLINRISRDSDSYANSFDLLCRGDLEDVSRVFSFGFSIAGVGLQKAIADKDDLRVMCGVVLLNALNTYSAAADILRRGYRLQPGILLRTVVESACTVLHLCQVPGDLQGFRDGRLSSSSTVTSAKKLLPPLGHVYGMFSGEFAHLGVLHREIQPTGPYKQRDLALNLNIHLLSLGAWLLHVTAELLYLDSVQQPTYWECRDGKECRYNPGETVREWLEKLLTPRIASSDAVASQDNAGSA